MGALFGGNVEKWKRGCKRIGRTGADMLWLCERVFEKSWSLDTAVRDTVARGLAYLVSAAYDCEGLATETGKELTEFREEKTTQWFRERGFKERFCQDAANLFREPGSKQKGGEKSMDRTIEPKCLSDETAVTPMAMFAVVGGRPIVFAWDHEIKVGRELEYARAVRQLHQQVIEHLDRWIRLAELPVSPKPKATP